MTNATWKKHPGSGDYNDGGNWTGGAVPNGVATFGASGTRALEIQDDATLRAWLLNAQAGAYSFMLDLGHSLSFTGAGIAVQHGSATVTDDGSIFFDNASSAGKAHINVTDNGGIGFSGTSNAGSAVITDAGNISFNGTASAAKSHFAIDGGALLAFEDSSKAGSAAIAVNSGATLDFVDTSSAGHAKITDNDGGTVNFNASSSAGSATITVVRQSLAGTGLAFSGSAGHARINNSGETDFNAGSSAAEATIHNSGRLVFNDSSAGSATISNSAELDFFGGDAGQATIDNVKTGASSGFVQFGLDGSADHATIVVDADTNVIFADNSTGGDARLINKAGGEIAFNSLGQGGDDAVSAGSIEGAGTVLLTETTSSPS